MTLAIVAVLTGRRSIVNGERRMERGVTEFAIYRLSEVDGQWHWQILDGQVVLASGTESHCVAARAATFRAFIDLVDQEREARVESEPSYVKRHARSGGLQT